MISGLLVGLLTFYLGRDRDTWQRMKDCRDAEVAFLERKLRDRETELERLSQTSEPPKVPPQC